jgi:hypothetical protein
MPRIGAKQSTIFLKTIWLYINTDAIKTKNLPFSIKN